MNDDMRPILLVEDNINDVLITKRAWKKCNIRNPLHITGDGEEALDFLYKRSNHKDAPTPMLILLDLKMPKMDGLEVLQQIKTDERLRSIPVIMLTSSDRSKDIDEAYQKGANSYIVKPVNFKQFIKSIMDVKHYWLNLCKIPGVS